MQTSQITSRRRFLFLASTVFAAVAIGLPTGLRAQPTTSNAVAFVKTTGERLIAVINASGTIQEKQPKLAQIIDNMVDVDAVAKFCLGRFWRNATPEQQKQYTALFHSVLINNITAKLGDYQGVAFTVQQAQSREDTAIVSTIIERPNNPPTKVDWVISEDTGAPRIIDVIAEGTSLRLTQRSDYAAYLTRNGNNVQALIDAMKQQLASNG